MFTALITLLLLDAAPRIPASAPAPPPVKRSSVLRGLSDDVQVLAETVRPSVALIVVAGYAPVPTGPLLARQESGGSGVVVDPEGYLVTNLHVVDGAQRIEVVLPPSLGPPEGNRSVLKSLGRTYSATVVGVDRETDIAVLKIPEKGLPAVAFGDSEALRPGQFVAAFGSPLGLEGSVSVGVVSAVARQLEPESPMIYVQTDASINPGNSGGPLLDLDGRLVGINTLIYSQSGGSEGIGFAAPANIVKTVFEQIRQNGRVRRGDIGARAQTITSELAAGLSLYRNWGVMITDVFPDGPAQRAGLQLGDVVLAIDGKPMENARQFNVNLYQRPAGALVALAVERGSERLTVPVLVKERAGDPSRLADLVSQERNVVEPLGILALDLADPRVAPLLPTLRARGGVIVAAAARDRPPWRDALQPGDAIYSLDGGLVLGLDALRAALEKARGRRTVVLQVERDSVLRYVTVPID